MTPDEYGTNLNLCINEVESDLDFDLVLSIAPYLGIPHNEAKRMIEAIKSSTSQWCNVAAMYGISRSEQEMKEGAFSEQ